MSTTWPWCEHISWEINNLSQKHGFYVHGDVGLWLTSSCNFCPICGAKRPEKPKTLSEKLADTYNNEEYTQGISTCDKLAQTALEHFLTVVDRCNGAGTGPWRDDVKKSMRASI